MLTEARGTRWRIWALVLFAAILFHLLLLWGTPYFPASAPQRRFQVDTIDPGRLEEIRRKWREDEGRLLLNKDPRAKDETVEPPPDARYFSDRNQRVEREQQGRRQDTLPRPGGPKRKALKPSRRAGQLSKFGVPVPVPEASQASSQEERESNLEPGADQALAMEDAPFGAETLLNTRESQYYSFYERIYQALAPIWRSETSNALTKRKLSPGDYIYQTDVVLDAEGNILDIHWVKSSGVRELDDAVEAAWKKIKKVANPPKALLDQHREVHLLWTYHFALGQGTGFQVQVRD